jgi:hypothetical protein
MSTILVEDRVCPLCKPVLHAIAGTCETLGHQVVRWRGPFSGRVPHSRELRRCQAAFVWNGSHPRIAPAVQQLQASGAQVAFVELGWNPQRGTCQIDRQGINAAASWAAEPLVMEGSTPLPLRQQGDLLVALQLDDDTQVTKLCPWFPSMRQFVDFLCRHSALPVRVRPHPKAPVDHALRRKTLELGGSWDDSLNFAAAMERCRAVAILNSSVGLEALEQRLPVLCYGLANYRHAGAVHCLDNSPATTAQVTAQLADGICDLTLERARAAYDRVMSHQWRCAEIPQLLPPLLASMLADESSQLPKMSSTSIWTNVQHWLRRWQAAA